MKGMSKASMVVSATHEDNYWKIGQLYDEYKRVLLSDKYKKSERMKSQNANRIQKIKQLAGKDINIFPLVQKSTINYEITIKHYIEKKKYEFKNAVVTILKRYSQEATWIQSQMLAVHNLLANCAESFTIIELLDYDELKLFLSCMKDLFIFDTFGRLKLLYLKPATRTSYYRLIRWYIVCLQGRKQELKDKVRKMFFKIENKIKGHAEIQAYYLSDRKFCSWRNRHADIYVESTPNKCYFVTNQKIVINYHVWLDLLSESKEKRCEIRVKFGNNVMRIRKKIKNIVHKNGDLCYLEMKSPQTNLKIHEYAFKHEIILSHDDKIYSLFDYDQLFHEQVITNPTTNAPGYTKDLIGVKLMDDINIMCGSLLITSEGVLGILCAGRDYERGTVRYFDRL